MDSYSETNNVVVQKKENELSKQIKITAIICVVMCVLTAVVCLGISIRSNEKTVAEYIEYMNENS